MPRRFPLPLILIALAPLGLLICMAGNASAESSKYVRFEAGDRVAYGKLDGDRITEIEGGLLFMGTPGKTSALKAGDVVEVELEGVGVLRNPVVAE